MKKRVLYIFILLSCFLSGQEFQQDFQKIMSRYGYDVLRPTKVGFNYFYDFGGLKDTSQFHIAVSIQNDFLQFLKEDKFIAKYQVNLIIKREERIIVSNTWEERLELDEFVKTNSFRDFQYLNYRVNLGDFNLVHFETGEYDVILDLRDLQSSITYKNVRKMKIEEEKKDNTFLTEIVFLASPADSGSEKLSVINMRNHIDFNRPYSAFVRPPHNIAVNSPVNVRLYRKDKEDKILLDQQYTEVGFSGDQRFMVQYDLPFQTMDEGDYVIRFGLQQDSLNFQVEKEFKVLWLWKPLYLYKVDLAVRPMKYLLSEEEMNRVKDYNIEELEKWFKAYWKENDPTPQTIYNEKQTFYFKRVSEAVRLYSNKDQEGWQTDFGKILILYGEPLEVENKKYSVNSHPHVIWKYIFEGETYEFKFIDDNKSGKYKLVE